MKRGSGEMEEKVAERLPRRALMARGHRRVGGGAAGRRRAAARSGRRGAVPGASALEVRVRQPRDGQPVLCAVPVRHPGRLRAARLRLSVDRVGDLRRGADGQRDEHGDRRQGRCDRRVPRRPEGFDRPVENALAAGIPVFSYNADSQSEQAARLYRPGSVPVRPDDGRAHRQAGRLGQGGDLYRHAGPAQPAAALSTARSTRSRNRERRSRRR